jgi:hypothetical protein
VTDPNPCVICKQISTRHTHYSPGWTEIKRWLSSSLASGTTKDKHVHEKIVQNQYLSIIKFYYGTEPIGRRYRPSGGPEIRLGRAGGHDRCEEAATNSRAIRPSEQVFPTTPGALLSNRLFMSTVRPPSPGLTATCPRIPQAAAWSTATTALAMRCRSRPARGSI